MNFLPPSACAGEGAARPWAPDAPPAVVTPRGGDGRWRRKISLAFARPPAAGAGGAAGRLSPTSSTTTVAVAAGPTAAGPSGAARGERRDMEAMLEAQRATAKQDAEARRKQLLEGGPARGGAATPRGTAGATPAGAAGGACGACGEALSALAERGEQLQRLHEGMARMTDEAEGLFDAARKIRERNERNSRWLPF